MGFSIRYYTCINNTKIINKTMNIKSIYLQQILTTFVDFIYLIICIYIVYFMQINTKRVIFLFTEWSNKCQAIIFGENIYVSGTLVNYSSLRKLTFDFLNNSYKRWMAQLI